MFVNQLYHGGIRALLDADGTIFDGMSLPEDISLTDVVDRIIFKYGDTPVFVPDPNVMKYYITSWSDRHLALWNRYKDAIETQYNPLENYDRYEKGTNTVERTISADNSTTYQPDNKETFTPDLHTYGNIGVTTSQQMLNQELDVIPRLDLIDYIADDFKTEFCLYIYE